MIKEKQILGIIVVVLILSVSLPCQAEEAQPMVNLFEGHGSVMLIIDPNTGAIEHVNKAAVNFYGYPVGELEKMQIQDINMLSPEEVAQEMQLAALEERNYFNFQHLLASGDIRHVEVYSYPVQWEGETKLYSIIHDVTPRLEAEQALYKRTAIFITVLGIATVILTAIALLLHHTVKTRNKALSDLKRSEEDLRVKEAFISTAMDNLPIGVAVNSVEPEIVFTYMNDNFPKFYHTTRGKLSAPGAFWDVVYEDPQFRKELKKRVLDDCASGNPENMYWENIPVIRDGKVVAYISANNTPVPEKDLMISSPGCNSKESC